MEQRIADLVEDRAVELDLVPLHLESHLLAEIAGQIAHQSGEALEHLAHRRHARLDHLGLQPADQPGDALRRRFELGIAAPSRQIHQPVPRHHQLAHLLHHRIEAAKVHPDLARADHRLGALGHALVEAHRRHVTGGDDRGHHSVVGRRRLEPEGEPTVELLALERRGGGPECRDRPEGFGATEREHGAAAPHRRVRPDRHGDRPSGGRI